MAKVYAIPLYFMVCGVRCYTHCFSLQTILQYYMVSMCILSGIAVIIAMIRYFLCWMKNEKRKKEKNNNQRKIHMKANKRTIQSHIAKNHHTHVFTICTQIQPSPHHHFVCFTIRHAYYCVWVCICVYCIAHDGNDDDDSKTHCGGVEFSIWMNTIKKKKYKRITKTNDNNNNIEHRNIKQ